ncbi:MAG: hypothetical protein A2270_07450 [Elusimicrobia bacterium RIFOXYA12_FULL_51_18]|nr:MAG: hypothetical protein A2270_07450 [Elusimicrobia bacterium RIFOXYA12_FULL_51_18]
MNSTPFRFLYWYLPSTFDTYKSDRIDVLPVIRNIYAPLITSFMNSRTEGMIAESWKVDPTGKTWRFKIRKGLTFDDGTPITADIVLKNFRRILWLTRKDALPLNSLMPEVRDWNNYAAPLKSIYATGDTLIFKLNKRAADLCEILDQAIYSIADPKCFDKNAQWKDDFCYSASGAYRVKSISKEKVVLESRHVFHSVEYAPGVVEIYGSPANRDFIGAITGNSCDMTVQMSSSLGKDKLKTLTSAGVAVTEGIATDMYFMELNHKHPPFSDPALRRSVRDVFFYILQNGSQLSSQVSIDHSFIPKGGMGYVKFHAPRSVRPVKGAKGKVVIISTPLPEKITSKDQDIKILVEEALTESLRLHGMTSHIIRLSGKEWYNRKAKGAYDIIYRASGISISDPFVSLRMMFMSKIGACIPDPSGKIPEIIKEAEGTRGPSDRRLLAEKINKTIFDDAAVLTFMHSGPVYLHNQGVDLSHFNSASDVVEFRAISWRPEMVK